MVIAVLFIAYLTRDRCLGVSLRQEEVHPVHKAGDVQTQSAATDHHIQLRARHLDESDRSKQIAIKNFRGFAISKTVILTIDINIYRLTSMF